MPSYLVSVQQTNQFECGCGFISGFIDIKTRNLIRKLHLKKCIYKYDKRTSSKTINLEKVILG